MNQGRVPHSPNYGTSLKISVFLPDSFGSRKFQDSQRETLFTDLTSAISSHNLLHTILVWKPPNQVQKNHVYIQVDVIHCNATFSLLWFHPLLAVTLKYLKPCEGLIEIIQISRRPFKGVSVNVLIITWKLVIIIIIIIIIIISIIIIINSFY